MAQLGTFIALVFATVVVAGCSSSVVLPDASTDSGLPDEGVDSSRPDTGERDSTMPTCPRGESYFEPGCGEGMDDYVDITAGCYAGCEGMGGACTGDDLICQRTVTNPCICRDGEVCCGACGTETWLCLPPPAPCEGRSYCECGGGCEPLVDVSTGCVCPCDDPFNCTGEMCDCACGGATYLGCAATGACADTEIDCGTCPVVSVDGCPACDPSCAP